MPGNGHVPFLEGGMVATPSCYSTTISALAESFHPETRIAQSSAARLCPFRCDQDEYRLPGPADLGYWPAGCFQSAANAERWQKLSARLRGNDREMAVPAGF